MGMHGWEYAVGMKTDEESLGDAEGACVRATCACAQAGLVLSPDIYDNQNDERYICEK